MVNRISKRIVQFGSVAGLCGALLVAGASSARATEPPPLRPDPVYLSITPDKKNVHPGDSVTFTVTVTHPNPVVLSWRASQPWGPLDFNQPWKGITNNTCDQMDTLKAGTQTCQFTVTPNLAKGEKMATTFTALQRWVQLDRGGIVSRQVQASTMIKGVGGGNR